MSVNSVEIKTAPKNSRTANILPFIEKILIFLKILHLLCFLYLKKAFF